MSESTRFERRLAALIDEYADGAPIAVDPLAVARRAAIAGRPAMLTLAFDRRVPRLGLAIAILALAIALIGSVLTIGGPSFRRDQTWTPVEGVEPFIGLPPEGAASSVPETGDLVLEFVARVHSLSLDVHFMWLYADGRLIWKRNADSWTSDGFGTADPGAVIEQRLTPGGVALLQSEVLATGLFDHDRADVGGPGVLWGAIRVHNGDRFVEYTIVNPGDPNKSAILSDEIARLLAGAPPASQTYDDIVEPITSEQRSAFAPVPGRLADPGSWLPSTMWLDRDFRGYVASRYAVCLGNVGLDVLPRPVAVILRARAVPQAYGPDITPNCHEVTTSDARTIASTLDASEFERCDPESDEAYGLPSVSDCYLNGLHLIAVRPDGGLILSGG